MQRATVWVELIILNGSIYTTFFTPHQMLLLHFYPNLRAKLLRYFADLHRDHVIIPLMMLLASYHISYVPGMFHHLLCNVVSIRITAGNYEQPPLG
ncbi:MAG: hypothetical protein R3E08_10335 [Thiotrichaceae bacterium]